MSSETEQQIAKVRQLGRLMIERERLILRRREVEAEIARIRTASTKEPKP